MGGLGGVGDSFTISNTDVNATVAGTGDRVGGLIGYNVGTFTANQISFIGSISATNRVGGLLGYCSGDIAISDAFTRVTVNATGDYVGGLVGELSADGNITDSIANSYVLGSMAGGEQVGGIVGQSYSDGNVDFDNVLVGASVSGTNYVGGLVGTTESNLNLGHSLVYGPVNIISGNGSESVGGLIASFNEVTHEVDGSSAYWDSEATGQSDSHGEGANKGTALTTAELQCPTSPGDEDCDTTAFSTWSSSNWNFGTSSEYPALTINNVLYRDSDLDGIEDSADIDEDNDGLIEIDDMAGFDEIRNNLDGTTFYGVSTGCPDAGCNGFELTTDLDFDSNGDGVIDAKDDYYVESGFADGWEPIPLGGTFTAILEGNGYALNNFATVSGGSVVGIFRTVDGAEFRNIVIGGDLTSMTGASRVGLLYGQNNSNGATISNCNLSGSVTATSTVTGGIGGLAESVSISNCVVNADITSASTNAGGLFGFLSGSSSIDNTSFVGTINSSGSTGGLVGLSGELQISNSRVQAEITSTNEYTGGLIGLASGAITMDSSYVLGSISGTTVVGGLIGHISSELQVTNAFVGSTITGSNKVGGLVGSLNDDLDLSQTFVYGAVIDDGSVADGAFAGLFGYTADTITITADQSYWDTEATGQSTSGGDGGTGLTTANLQCPTSPGDDSCLIIFSNWSEATWDFGTNNQYPGLIIDGLIYRDSDGDGVDDLSDAFPEDASESADSDGDGIGDNAETAAGMDPYDADDFYVDSDGDHVPNGYELLAGTDPNDANDFPNFLDTSVNGGGYFQLSVTPSADYYENYASLLAQGDDDKMYYIGSIDGDETSFFMSRFDENFNLDTNYGTDGYIFGYDLGVNSYYAEAIQFESDGTRLLALPSCNTLKACVVALDSDGNRSTTRFTTQDTPGSFLLDNSSQYHLNVLKTSDGGYLVFTYSSAFNGKSRVFRIDENDELDTSFNDNNTYLTFDFDSSSGAEVPVAIFETASNEFLLASRKSNTLYLAKINSQGELISTFGSDGVITDALGISQTVRHMIKDKDEGFFILADDVSGSEQGLFLYRMNEDGSLDQTFGEEGYVAFPEPSDRFSNSAVELMQQSDGDLLVTISLYDSTEREYTVQIAKLNTAGEYISDFGVGGVVSYNLGSLGTPDTVALNHNNKIVIAGNDDDETFNYFLVFDNTNDDDGDGINDDEDAFPDDAGETTDSDNDGVGDNTDAFPNDPSETTDSDNDGVGDNADEFPNDASETTDSDSDGVGDNADAFPNDASETTDSDYDGVGDNADAFPNDASETTDSDNDGVGDNADAFPNDASETTDSDNDGVGDSADAFPNDATETSDNDNDGIGNNADTDDDNDGVNDSDDAFPFDASETMDTDNDGIGNNADTDDDNDGVADSSDAFPLDASETTDTDSDGVGDNSDAFPTDPTESADSDSDGVGDISDAFPNDASETTDTDNDGIGNNADTDDDNDGVNDSDDAFPLDATETTDTDNDGIGNNADTDDDNDGVEDSDDAFPLDTTETTDTDNDGIGNNADTDDDNDGVEDSDDAFPLDTTETTDTDNDGIGNNADTDDDNDGVEDSDDAFPLDATETTDTDNDGVGNNADTDDDNDGVEDSEDAFPLDGNESKDSDGDGIGDNADDTPYPASGEINFEFSDYTVAEDGMTVELKVVRSNGDYEQLSVDYALTDAEASASNDYEFVTGTLIFADGETEKAISINIIDDAMYEGDETFQATLSNLQSIGEASLGNQSTTTITITENEDVPPAGVIEVASTEVTVDEDAGTVNLNILRTNGSFGEVSVSVYTQDGSAVAGVDYTATSTMLTFADGETEKTVSLTLLDDAVYEGDESFTLNLSMVTGDATLGSATTSITLVDDEPVPPAGVLEIELEFYSVNENVSELSFNIVRSGGSFGEVSVNVQTEDQSALANADYLALNESITFANGEMLKTLTISIIDDETYEGSESFGIKLNPAAGTQLGTVATATVQIVEDDAVPPAGVIQFSGANYNIDEDAQTLSITVTRTNGSFGDISFDISTADGTAIAGEDYAAIDGNYQLLDGETSLVITLEILDDTVYEGDEGLQITLANVEGGATLGSLSAATISILENEEVPPSGAIRLSGSNFNVNEATGVLTLTVMRVEGSFGDISVDYEVSAATAVAGEDFEAASGTLHFADGEVSQSISVTIIDDELVEALETFEITLSNPVNTSIEGDTKAIVEIADNDNAPVEDATASGGAASFLLFMALLLSRRKASLQAV